MSTEWRPHPQLLLRRDGDVLHVTLDAPDRLNAQTPSLWRALAGVATGLSEGAAPEAGTRFAVLHGTGQAFSAGLDRGMLAPGGMPGEPDLLSLAATDPQEADRLIGGYQRAFTAWRDSPAIVVAAVQGHAVGAGFQLALGADLRIVADDVRFVMAEPSLGLVPDLGGTAALTELVGYSRALEICCTARSVGAGEAVSLGLASIAVPAEELDAAVDDVLAALRASPAASVGATKALLAGAGHRARDEQLAAERAAQVRCLRTLAAGRGADA
ncbi:MAG: enoyl-CoA hydratase/isomerase family protein [Dermatophilaceae bacterium]